MAADTAVEEAWRLALFPTASSARRYRLACFAQLVGMGVMLIALALALADLPLTGAVFGLGFFMLWFSFVYLGVFAGRVRRRWQEAYMAMAEPPPYRLGRDTSGGIYTRLQFGRELANARLALRAGHVRYPVV